MNSTNQQPAKIDPEPKDLIIIGAGPAGLSTALHLLQIDSKWKDRIFILEKLSHPREKLCGGGVTRLGLEVLRDLGFKTPLPLPQAPVEDVQLIFGNRNIHVGGKPQFVVFHRAELDAYLAKKAKQRGVVIYENEQVIEIETGSEAVTVTTNKGKYIAKTVVGADGAKGFTRKYFKGPSRDSRVARLLEVISAASSESAHFQNRSAIFNFTPVQNDLQGYFWEFPSWRNRQPTFNLGVYDSRMAAQFPRARLLDILKAGLENSGKGSINIKPKGHPIHLFSPVNHFSLKRMLLVGDALGAEPLFGEGIGPALGLGKIAAETIQNAFDRDDFTFRNYRWRVLNSRVGRYLLARWLAAWSAYRLCRWPIFMHFLWSAGKFSATLWPKPSKM